MKQAPPTKPLRRAVALRAAALRRASESRSPLAGARAVNNRPQQELMVPDFKRVVSGA